MLPRLALVPLLLVSLALPAAAGMRDSPQCKTDLDALFTSLDQSSARLQRTGNGKSPEACTAYQTYFLDVVKARSITAQCKTGPERDQDLGKLDVNAEQANNGIAARCG